MRKIKTNYLYINLAYYQKASTTIKDIGKQWECIIGLYDIKSELVKIAFSLRLCYFYMKYANQNLLDLNLTFISLIKSH